MPRNFSVDHDRLSPQQFSQGLADAGLGQKEFCRLTGARLSKVKVWLKSESMPGAEEPPFWVTSWLALYTVQGAPVVAKAVADQFLILPGTINDHEAEYALHD
jgi:hypothetical protein